MNQFIQSLFQPISYSSRPEAITEVTLGAVLLAFCLFLALRGNRSTDHEKQWTERRLQLTGVFGTILLLLAFLRYEGIPYASMPVVLGLVAIWAIAVAVQLALYRQLVLKPARAKWREQKTHAQYLPKPKARTTR